MWYLWKVGKVKSVQDCYKDDKVVAPQTRKGVMAVTTSLGSELKRLRENMRLTQEEAAIQAGVKRATLSNLETQLKKRPNKAILAKLAETYGVTLDYLLELTWWSSQGKAAPKLGSEWRATAFTGLSPEVQNTLLDIAPILERLVQVTRVQAAKS